MKNKAIYLIIVVLLVLFAYKFGANSKSNTSEITPVLTNESCSRAQPYTIAPEFVRALSLIRQREVESYQSVNQKPPDDIRNCLDVQYSDVKDKNSAEGLFVFDKNFASKEKLPILVDNSYKNYDDLLTALLLAHEATHARQYLNELNNKLHLGCFEKEENAFQIQMGFYMTLNQEEKNYITARLNQNDNSPQLVQLRELIDLFNNVGRTCGNDSVCFNDTWRKSISTMVRSSPFYQKECNL